MMVDLRITHPLPSTLPAMVIQIDPEVTSCKISTSKPGGYNALAVGMPEENQPIAAYLPRAVDIEKFFHVEASYGSTKLFEGRVMKRHMPGGGVRGFQAVGYGLTGTNDDYYTSAGTAWTPAGTVLREVLQKAPLLSISTKPGEWVDSGIQHQRVEFNGMTPAQVIDRLAKEGGPSGSAAGTAADWNWMVWEGRIFSWAPNIPPATARYFIDLADVVIDEDATNMFGAVSVAYGSAKALTPERSDPAFVATYGFRRAHVVQGSSLAAAQAVALRDAEYVQHRVPDLAIKITLKDGAMLRLASGQQQPVHLIRAAEWIQVGSTSDLPMLDILHAEYDALAEAVTLTVGAYPADWYQRVRETWRLTASYKNLTNPSSGAFI